MKIDWSKWDLVISASQVETWDACHRKWWFSKVARLPELDKGFQIYGNVIHAVADRFFSADDLGYDRATGKPVDLYPAGWEVSHDRTDKAKILGTVTPQEQAQIKLLVRKAIDEGIWVRMPDRESEASFFRPVIDRVAIIGYIDLMLPTETHDHKSTKNMSYAKSAKDLETNTQLLIYAKEVLARGDEKGMTIENVTVRHNTFSKDPKNPVVRSVRADIPRAKILEHWESVKLKADDMRKLKKANISHWSAVPRPKDDDSCKAYGGCAFLSICGKTETPEKYRARIELASKAQQAGATTLTQGKNNMGIFDKLKQTATATATAAPAAAPKAPAPPSMPKAEDRPKFEPAPPAKEEIENKGLHPDQTKAPWAREGCKGCRGMGITKQGTACRVCDTLNKKDGKPTSASWTLTTGEDGRISWTDAKGATGSTPAVLPAKAVDKTTAEHAPAKVAATEPAKTAAPEAAQAPAGGALAKRRPGRPRKDATQPAAAPAAEQAPEPTPEEIQEVAPEAAVAAIETAANEPGKPGRRPQGFTLLIGCLPERTKTTGVIGLDQEFERFGTELAVEMGAESYYALDAYKRRDWMAMRAKQIAETFGSKTVTAVGESPDFKEFVAAIKPHASYVIVGVSR